MTTTIPIQRRYGCPQCGCSKLKAAQANRNMDYLVCERCDNVFEAVKPLSDVELMKLAAQYIEHMPKGTVLKPTLLELHMRTTRLGVVLWCYRDEAPHPTVTRYCTHELVLDRIDEWSVTIHHGHYDMSLSDAAEDYMERCQGKWT